VQLSGRYESSRQAYRAIPGAHVEGGRSIGGRQITENQLGVVGGNGVDKDVSPMGSMFVEFHARGISAKPT